MDEKREARKHLIVVQKLLDQGDSDGALKENEKVLSLSGSIPPGDEALFNAGLIYANYNYSKKDYQKSWGYFRRLVSVFPESLFARQAKIWIGILQENERLNKGAEESNKSIRKSQQENERLKREIEELNKMIEKSKQVDIEIDQKKKEILK
jgi:tetratricopeptide (TPR) repeat protein